MSCRETLDRDLKMKKQYIGMKHFCMHQHAMNVQTTSHFGIHLKKKKDLKSDDEAGGRL